MGFARAASCSVSNKTKFVKLENALKYSRLRERCIAK